MDLRTKIVLFFNKSYYYKKLAYLYQKWSVERNPIKEISRNYELRFHKKPDLDSPQNLIEKIYWMQLHCDTSKWTLCADKYRMRSYVTECGFENYLPKLYGVWEDPDDIKWDQLPSQMVIKANNGCATVLVIKDKSAYDEKKLKKEFNRWLSIPYGYRAYQPHYLSIKPCILAEELLEQGPELNEISSSIVDFKTWCFNGRVECFFITYNRKGSRHSVDLYDANWNKMKEHLNFNGAFDYQETLFPKPSCLEEMKMIASRLSKGFPEMRVDFYVINGKPVIGELTLSAGYGNLTEDYYNYLGSLTDVTLLKQIK